MLRIRTATAGVFLLCFSVMTAGGAHAQMANTLPGKPLQLVPVLTHAETAKPKVHARRMSRRPDKTHLVEAEEKTRHLAHPPEAAAAAPPPKISPGPETAAPADVPAASPPPPAQPAMTSAAPEPSALVVGGHTVEIVSPDDANVIDLAADPPSTDAPDAMAAAATTPSEVAEAEPASGAGIVARAHEDPGPSPVGSASWLAQVFAALGGAVAAGSVAWILIGSAPQRTYG